MNLYKMVISYFLARVYNIDLLLQRILRPLIYFLLFVVLNSQFDGIISGLNGASYAAFLLPGIIFDTLLSNGCQGLVSELGHLRTGGLLMLSRITPSSGIRMISAILINSFIWSIIDTLFMYLLCNYVLGVGLTLSAYDVFNFALLFIMMMLIFQSLALLLASFGTNSENPWTSVFSILFVLLPILSGAYIGIEQLANPTLARYLLLINPFAEVVTLMRQILVYHTFHWHDAFYFVLNLSAVALIMGCVGIYRLQKKTAILLRF